MSSNALAVPGEGQKPMQEYTEVTDALVALVPGDAGAPLSIKRAAAHIAVAHGLNIFTGEVYVFSTGSYKDANDKWQKRWTAEVGIKGYRRSARDQGDYEIEFDKMTDEVCKEHVGPNWTEDDVGIICRGYRLDRIERLKALGLPITPKIAYGFWRKQSTYKNNKWKQDGIPASWTRRMVAEKQAEKNWIKQNFDLGFSNETVQMEEEQTKPDTIVMDADAALLWDNFGEAGLKMEGDQRFRTLALIRSRDEADAEWVELTPEEKKSRTEQNANDLGMGAKKPKRLGDEADLSNVEPEVVEEEPVGPDRSAAEVLEEMRAQGSVLGKDEEVAEGQFTMDLDEPKPEPEADWIADSMKQFPGLFKSRADAERVLVAIRASAKSDAEAKTLWDSVVSRKVDELSDKESK